MRNFFATILFTLFFFFIPQSRGDLFGGDVAVLTQILVNNIQQLTQLMEIVQTGQRQVELMEDIKREIFDTVDRIESLSHLMDPGLYKEWRTVSDALQRLHMRYGDSVPSPNFEVERDMDQSVAEAITLNNQLYDYSRQVDEIGETIKQSSQNVSPGGAQKLTAHTQGILLHLLNQNLRAQATALKLQAQSLAMRNREQKLHSKQQVATSNEMERELRQKRELFKLPRF
jgi:hypothetical protein